MENDIHYKDFIKIALIENQNGSTGHQPTVGPLRQVGAFRRAWGWREEANTWCDKRQVEHAFWKLI